MGLSGSEVQMMDGKRWTKISRCIFWNASIASLLVIVLVAYGCAGLGQSMAENPGWSTTICAGGGALVGAAAGGVIDKDNPLRGALIGALSGAALGGATCFAIAKFSSTQVKDYQQTRDETRYQPSQGTVVRVNSFTVEPTAVSPGQKLTFSGEYYVMTPEREADLPVIERMIVSSYDERAKQWKELGRTQNQVTIKPGTRRITPSEINAPAKPPGQQFQFALQVEHDKVVDSKSQGVYMALPQASAPSDVAEVVAEVIAQEVRLAKVR
jgi:hypothetical protein